MWVKAKELCRLNQEDIRMAKELGFQPKSLIKNIPSPNQEWKAPVKEWIRDLYAKKFGARSGSKPLPPANDVASWFESLEKVPLTRPESLKPIEIPEFDPETMGEDDFFMNSFHEHEPPDEKDIEEQNYFQLRRQKVFFMAAMAFANEAAQIPWVTKVALFGSVSKPLEKEVPRFSQYRRARIQVWHECKDVDIAVWITDRTSLNLLRIAVNRALKNLMEDTDHMATPAHHQLDIFLIDAGTAQYIGNLCHYNACPKDKPDCLTPGCGASGFLKIYQGFVFHDSALQEPTVRILFDRHAPQKAG